MTLKASTVPMINNPQIDPMREARWLARCAKATRRIESDSLIEAINEQRGAHAPPTHDELVAYVERLKRDG